MNAQLMVRFANLFEQHAPELRSALRRYGVAPTDVDDALLEVLRTAMRTYDPSLPARPWLLLTAYRVARNSYHMPQHSRAFSGERSGSRSRRRTGSWRRFAIAAVVGAAVTAAWIHFTRPPPSKKIYPERPGTLVQANLLAPEHGRMMPFRQTRGNRFC